MHPLQVRHDGAGEPAVGAMASQKAAAIRSYRPVTHARFFHWTTK